jgi:predicted Fe-Mo cluster-binding NifX family protein
MSWRVAVTSADGVLVNQHFGHAQWFLIYDLEKDGSAALVERREVVPWCNKDRHGDEEEGTAGIASDIPDCGTVLTAQIGGPARKKLELSGLTVFAEPAEIADALGKLARYYSKTGRAEQTA